MWTDLITNTLQYQRLDYVWRYSSIPTIHHENVSTHSYWVCTYANWIYNEVFKENTKYLVNVLVLSLTHDFMEHATGDVVRVFKYSSQKLKEEIDQAEEKMVQSMEPKIQRWLNQWQLGLNREESAMVKAIVKGADFLSLYTYMRREKLRGNNEVNPFYDIMMSDIGKMTSEPKITLGEVCFDQSNFYSEMLLQAMNIRDAK